MLVLFLSHLESGAGHLLIEHSMHNETGHIVHFAILLIGVMIFLILAPSRFQEDRQKRK